MMDPRRAHKRRIGRWRFLVPIVVVPFFAAIIITAGLLLLFPTMIPFAASLHLRDYLSIWVGYALIAFGVFLPFMSLGCCVACTSPTANARARESMMADALLEEMVGGLGGALAEHYDVFQRGTSFYGTGWGRHMEVQEGYPLYPAPILEEEDGHEGEGEGEGEEGQQAEAQAGTAGQRSAPGTMSTVDALTAAFGLAAAKVGGMPGPGLGPGTGAGKQGAPSLSSHTHMETGAALSFARDAARDSQTTTPARPSMTLVLLCGEGSPRVVNRGLAQHIAARTGFRALTVDLPGHGSLASVAFSLARCERVLRAVIEKELSQPSVPSLAKTGLGLGLGQRMGMGAGATGAGADGIGFGMGLSAQGSSGRSLSGQGSSGRSLSSGREAAVSSSSSKSPVKSSRLRSPSKRATAAVASPSHYSSSFDTRGLPHSVQPGGSLDAATMPGQTWPTRAATKQVVLVAYGASAYVAAHFAACSPGLLAGVVILGTVPRYDQFSPRNAAMKALYRLPWIHGLANLGLLGKVQAKAAASAAASATAAALSSSGVGGGSSSGAFHGSSTGRHSHVDESMEDDRGGEAGEGGHFDSGAASVWGRSQGLFTADTDADKGRATASPSSKVRPFVALRQQAGKEGGGGAEATGAVREAGKDENLLSEPLLAEDKDAELAAIANEPPAATTARSESKPWSAPAVPLDPSRVTVQGYLTHLRNAQILPTDHTPLAQVLVDEGCEWNFRVKPSYIREVQYARGYSAAENALMQMLLDPSGSDGLLGDGDDIDASEEDMAAVSKGMAPATDRAGYIPPTLTLVDPSLRPTSGQGSPPVAVPQPPPLVTSSSMKRGFVSGARGGGLWSALSALPRPVLVLGPEAWVRSARKLLPVPQVRCMAVKGVRDETLPTLSARKTDALAAMLTEFATQAFAISEQRLVKQELQMQRRQQLAAARAAESAAQGGSAIGLPSRAIRMSVSGPASAAGRRHSSLVSGVTGRSGSVMSHGTWSSPGTASSRNSPISSSQAQAPPGPAALVIAMPAGAGANSRQHSPSVLAALARRGGSRSSSMGSASAFLGPGGGGGMGTGMGMQRRPSSLAEMQARFSVSSPEPVPEGAEKEAEHENEIT